MKTSLYLTDVMVLHHEGDTVNFLGLEITKTSKGFEVKSSTDFVESLFGSLRVDNSKPTAYPGRRSTVMELASATPLGGHTHLHVTLETRHAICRPPAIHTSPQSHNRKSLRVVKQLLRYLTSTRNTLLFVSNLTCRFKKVCWKS